MTKRLSETSLPKGLPQATHPGLIPHVLQQELRVVVPAEVELPADAQDARAVRGTRALSHLARVGHHVLGGGVQLGAGLEGRKGWENHMENTLTGYIQTSSHDLCIC